MISIELLTTSPLFCADLPDEVSKLKYQASFNYYQGLRSLGHAPTPQEQADLAGKLYSPLVNQYEQAIEEINNQALAEAKTQHKQESEALQRKTTVAPPPPPSSTEPHLRQSKPGGSRNNRQPSQVKSDPPVVIDGSQFPKVLVFPGVKNRPQPRN